MISQCVLSIDNRRHIEQHVRQTEQNKALLDVFVERNSSTFRVFKAVLRESGYEDILLNCSVAIQKMSFCILSMTGTNTVYNFCRFLKKIIPLSEVFFFFSRSGYINMHIGRKTDNMFIRFVIYTLILKFNFFLLA